MINRIFELKSVQFTGISFRNQKFAEIDKNLKKIGQKHKILTNFPKF